MTRPGGVFTPLVRWAGGKAGSVGDILHVLPAEVPGTYYEPMAGGAAVFWALVSGMRVKRAVLGDVNEDLMNFYLMVRDRVDEFVSEIERHAPHVSESDYYYRLRAVDVDLMTDVERAARFLYLNKTCFNGLYRVNRAGQFNVPYGKVQAIFDYAAIHNASTVLRDVDLRSGDYRETCDAAQPGDVVYVDPPYWPRRKNGFVAYDRLPFGPAQQAELASWCRTQAAKGVTVLASNHDVEEVRKLYDGSRFIEMQERRSVAADGGSRKAVGSLLIVVNGGQHGQLDLAI